jgi:hypothetical protein
MDRHGISQSVISIPPPALPSFTPEEAVKATLEANADLENYCTPQDGESQDGPSSIFSPGSAKQQNASSLGIPPKDRIRAFAMLPPPVKGRASQHSVLDVLESTRSVESIVGLTMSTAGLGKGLGDPELEAIWAKADELGLTIFVHPPNEELKPAIEGGSDSAVFAAPHRVALVSR